MGMGFRHGGYLDGFGGHGIGVFGVMLFIVFWAAMALLILTLVQNYRHGPRHLHHHGAVHGPATVVPRVETNPAVDILRERFAKGEVTEEEFTRRLALLRES